MSTFKIQSSPTDAADWGKCFGHIQFELEGGLAWLVLNRPEALNATTYQMFDEIESVFERVRSDPQIRVLVLTGAGPVFCIGSDLSNLAAALEAENLSAFRDYLSRINQILFALEELPIPTIAMVNGRARAGGFEIILACDFVVVSEDAAIGDVHTPFGHIPGAGATQRLPRKIGRQKALELILSGKWLSGREAVDYGIALKAAPPDRLAEETKLLASQFTDKARESLQYVKRAMLRGAHLSLQDGIEMEMHYYLEYLATSPVPREAFRANQQKRSGSHAEGTKGNGADRVG
jgi:2-(1,2-epoxy-1,2-dihydrophenyl)acetyl-CoA isomerase/putative hydratase